MLKAYATSDQSYLQMEGNHYLQSQIYNRLIQMGKMTERKAWTQVEDNILKQLYEKKNIKKWSEISRIMEVQYQIRGRNGKQCRERYHNHLNDNIRHEKWVEAEQKQLIKHHNQIGNKWAQISRFLNGRSENDIKNQFYSILRRGLRQINQFIRKQLKRYKQLQIDTLYKIVEACQNNYRRKVKTKVMADNMDLKKTIIHYAFNNADNLESDAANIKKFIEKVKNLNKTGNKQPKIKEKTQEVEEKESEQIDQQEQRDNCPLTEVKIYEGEQKFRKSSFFNFTLEQPEMELQFKNDSNLTHPTPYKLRKRSSFYSNHSFDMSSPKWNQSLDPIFKALEMQQTDNYSPRPLFFASSPYFDHTKSSFTNLTHPTHHH